MKICFLALANNYHTQKWCEYFIKKDYEVDVISFVKGEIDGATVHYIDCNVSTNDSDFKKIRYLFQYKKVREIINQIKPDIINAHYATSYGMVAALAVPHKFICSVWGSDVYSFPKKSFLHKKYFKYVLKKAKYIFSTSKVMGDEVKKYTNKKIFITPFGVKMDLFNPNKKNNEDKNLFTIGTAKPLEKKYGINYLIEAVSIVNTKRPDINISLKIAGQGSKEEEYKKLAIEKSVSVEWLGLISQEEVAYEFANMDIAVFPSIDDSESFGVAAIEAQACGIPIIISNISGLMETSIPNKTSIVVHKKDATELANAIIDLYDNSKKRKQMGLIGRKYVLENYEYNNCFKKTENCFISIRNNI